MGSEEENPNWRDVKLGTAFIPNFRILRLFGYWPPAESSRILRKIYIIIAFFFIGFEFITYTISELINIVLSLGDLEEAVQGLFLFLTHLGQVVKLYYFYKNNIRVRALLNSLERDIFKPKNYFQFKMIENAIRQAKFVFYFFMYMGWGTCSLWAIFPFFDSGSNGEKILPLRGYYPFNTKVSPNYEMVFAYQILATTINASTNISMDTTVSGFVCHVCGQLDILNDKLLKIKEYSVENLKRKKQCAKLEENEILDDELQLEMDRMLLHCIDHHRNIIEYTNEIGELFNVGIFGQFAVGTVIICLTMFKLTLVSLMSLQFLSLVLYQGCMLTEIILYCWFGNEVILKSSNLTSSIYHSDWISCTMAYKKKLLFVMLRTYKPIKLYAGNFFTLSVETLVAILRSSWSYFAVLNQVNQK